MLSYPIPEAEELLSNKLSAAQQSLSNCEEDLDFLREQVTVRVTTSSPRPAYFPAQTMLQLLQLSIFSSANVSLFQTMEVATARVYNWDISQKRKEEKEAGASS
jgi:hypothetical protein